MKLTSVITHWVTGRFRPSHITIASQRLRSYDLMALYKSVYCYCYYYNCEQRYFAFVPRNAMLASTVFAVVCPSVRLSVCPSVRPSQAGIVSKRLDESSWILVRRLPFTYPTLWCKQIWVFPRFGYLLLELCHKLRT